MNKVMYFFPLGLVALIGFAMPAKAAKPSSTSTRLPVREQATKELMLKKRAPSTLASTQLSATIAPPEAPFGKRRLELVTSVQSYRPRGTAMILGSESYALEDSGDSTMFSLGAFWWNWNSQATASYPWDIGFFPGVAFSQSRYPIRASSGFLYNEIYLKSWLGSARAAAQVQLGRMFAAGITAGPGFLFVSQNSPSNSTAEWSSSLWHFSAGPYLKFMISDGLSLGAFYEYRQALAAPQNIDVQRHNLEAALAYRF